MHRSPQHDHRPPSRTLPALALALAALFGPSSCAAPTQKPIPVGAPPLGRYDAVSIRSQAESLLVELKVGDKVRQSALARLDEFLAAPENAARIAADGVNGVGAFQVGTGGVLIVGGGGEGFVSFAGGSQKLPFKVSGLSVGANVGGGSNIGVALIFGLDHEQRFPDRYTMTATGGSYGDNTYLHASGTPERSSHKLECVATGIGFGARAGGGKMTIATE
jgi:hypothetical protein